ncbi:chromo domain-containing protein cec-1-like [Cucurbita pepo subsp. pepo]|uniref:chromo domain-containing protein cec-1-like n=1 Tax=Cucurbita pepo subsp. pepo TaxID=3664 RepID=UPI000C9D7326|nr:chromo domain-containing protein cec-1-like [Cucurbita pepo subsp. pepo]
MEGGRRRITLYDQMLAVGEGRELTGGLTLNDVLTVHKRASPNPSPEVRLNGRTLLDILRDDVGKSPAVGNRERKSWKFLRDRLRLNLRSQIPPPNSLRFAVFSSAEMTSNEEESPESTTPVVAAAVPVLRQISRRSSTRLSQNIPTSPEATNSGESPENNDSASTIAGTGSRSSRSLLRPQMSRRNSTRRSLERSESFTDLTEPVHEGTRRLSAALAMERSMSARETVATQEAADAETTADEDDEEADSTAVETAAPVRMSLMDLLEETDRQMGFEGSRYKIEDEVEEEEEEEEEEEKEEEVAVVGGGSERKCCVCMVRHKGAAFIPCGHTFCRLCSRELLVSRGNCPLCNGFILEILDIF